jgi:lipopolysaccharide transport protein LptA
MIIDKKSFSISLLVIFLTLIQSSISFGDLVDDIEDDSSQTKNEKVLEPEVVPEQDNKGLTDDIEDDPDDPVANPISPKDVVPTDAEISDDSKRVSPSPGDKNTSKKPRRVPVDRGAQAKQPVHFKSDDVSGIRDKGVIELHRNVEVNQGDFSLNANQAKVFFNQQSDEVETIVASGNIKINKVDPQTGHKVRAYGKEVVFNQKDQTVTLSGDAKLHRGKDIVRGQRIIYNLTTGWIKAEQVAGVVQPQSNAGQ